MPYSAMQRQLVDIAAGEAGAYSPQLTELPPDHPEFLLASQQMLAYNESQLARSDLVPEARAIWQKRVDAARKLASLARQQEGSPVQENPPSGSGNPVLSALALDPKVLLYGGLGLAGAAAAGLTIAGMAGAFDGKDKRGRVKGRAHEKRKGITGSAKQYKRDGGGEVKYTKRGQPYVITADGRAKFIKAKGRTRA